MTSEEGFELSAPIVVLIEDQIDCATMGKLGEVGAHGLAAEDTLTTSLPAIARHVEPLQNIRDVASSWNALHSSVMITGASRILCL